jgi:hypothetical protein
LPALARYHRVMSRVADFETYAIARLRRQVAQLDEANADLLAYARGHVGAAAQIHAAALAAMEAQDFEHLIHVVTEDWTDILGVDAVALALATDTEAVRAGPHGLQMIDPALLRPLIAGPPVTLRAVDRGAAVFGPAASLIRSEALVRLEPFIEVPAGVLALGARKRHNFEGGHGGELLGFLGATVSRMIARWFTTQR